MKDFSIIKQLNDPTEVKESIKSNIEYQQYDLTGKKDKYTILIPVRECENFEQSLEQLDEDLSSRVIRELLRKHRGIRNTEK